MTHDLNEELNKLEQGFALWRQNKKRPKDPVPPELWDHIHRLMEIDPNLPIRSRCKISNSMWKKRFPKKNVSAPQVLSNNALFKEVPLSNSPMPLKESSFILELELPSGAIVRLK